MCLCCTSITCAKVAESGTLTSPEADCQSEDFELVVLSKTSPSNVTDYVPSAAGNDDSDESHQVKYALC